MRKITGAYRSMLGETEFHERELPLKNPGAFLPAVMVVGDTNDEVPRLFTEGEVRVILRDLLAAAEDGPYMPNYDRMDEMVKFHGLSFDPA